MNSPIPTPGDARFDATRRHLVALRAELARRGVDALVVPRADEYLGEYIPAHNERLRWLSGFTGSAGAVVVTADRAAIFVDGRYTVQVRRQVSAQDFSFHDLMDEPPAAWLTHELPAGSRVLVDPRMFSLEWFNATAKRLGESAIEILAEADNPIDRCWEDRPAEQIAEALCLGEEHSGESSASKRERVGKSVSAAGADAALIFAPESVSWLLNLRGCDVPRLPVLLSYALLSCDGSMQVVVDPRRIPASVHAHVGDGVGFLGPGEGE
ncbi:MAG: aminopeptidase P family N-terminal domain-containing protein, partial [Pseudomonadota bacterium]